MVQPKQEPPSNIYMVPELYIQFFSLEYNAKTRSIDMKKEGEPKSVPWGKPPNIAVGQQSIVGYYYATRKVGTCDGTKIYGPFTFFPNSRSFFSSKTVDGATAEKTFPNEKVAIAKALGRAKKHQRIIRVTRDQYEPVHDQDELI